AAEEGIAVLVSSHLLAEMELMCSRVVVIQEGKFVTERALGEPVEKTEERVNVTFRVGDVEAAKTRLIRMEEIRLLGMSPERNEVTVAV
ncbi:bacitracin ABC transporter ATP-binding protein, partial [Paenibacillus barengoltzii]|nr:bacitracin ABC transporter ATP-binding protein [Paenibacillus barengoltzii]